MVTKAANSPLVVRLDAFPITDLVRNHWRNPAQEGQHPRTPSGQCAIGLPRDC